jgi:cytochrome P450
MRPIRYAPVMALGDGAPESMYVDFDPFSLEYTQQTACDINRRLRSHLPAHSTHYGGFWPLSRHADVMEAFKRDGTELSARHETLDDGLVLGGVILPPMAAHLGFMEQDPPLFTPIRQALNPWFTPRAVASRKPRIDEVASALLDLRIESGSVEMLDDLIRPLAAITTLELLGLPLDGVGKFALPAQTTERDSETAGAEDVWSGLERDLTAEVTARRADGRRRDDVIETLMQLRIDGVPLPEQLVVDSVFILLIGGVETVVGAFGGAIHHLDAHPEDRWRLAHEPALLRAAFDEFLRVITPTTQNARTALCDFELAGVTIRRGDVVYLNLLAANHDEREFPDPETVVLDRRPNRHVALGAGIHHCIGAHLARAMWTAMMEQVLERIPDYQIVHETVQEFPTAGISNGFARLPAIFTRGPRRPASLEVERDVARALASR